MPLLMFLILPVLEIAVFIQVGDWIGVWPTVLLVVLAAFLGSALLRYQGFGVLSRAQAAAERGEPPVGAVFEGFCIVTAAVLLIVPGFLSDVVGLALFVPFLRKALGAWLFERMRRQQGVRVWVNGHNVAGGAGGPGAKPPPPGVIDVDYHEVAAEEAEADTPSLPESRWRPPGPGEPRGNP